MKFILSPPEGFRTYRLLLIALFLGTAIAVFGIIHGADLIGLAGVIAAVVAPVVGAAAWNNRGTPGASPPAPPA